VGATTRTGAAGAGATGATGAGAAGDGATGAAATGAGAAGAGAAVAGAAATGAAATGAGGALGTVAAGLAHPLRRTINPTSMTALIFVIRIRPPLKLTGTAR
jgi:hypothetical protein